MTLSPSYYHRVNVLCVHFLPEYRSHLHISLPPKDYPKFLACCVLPENLPQFYFWELPYYLLEMNTGILIGPTSKNPLDLNQAKIEVRQLVHFYLSINQETSNSGTWGQQGWNVQERHHAWNAVPWHYARNQARYFPRKLCKYAL